MRTGGLDSRRGDRHRVGARCRTTTGRRTGRGSDREFSGGPRYRPGRRSDRELSGGPRYRQARFAPRGVPKGRAIVLTDRRRRRFESRAVYEPRQRRAPGRTPRQRPYSPTVGRWRSIPITLVRCKTSSSSGRCCPSGCRNPSRAGCSTASFSGTRPWPVQIARWALRLRSRSAHFYWPQRFASDNRRCAPPRSFPCWSGLR